MECQIFDILKDYDKNCRSVDANIINNDLFEHKVDGEVSISISHISYDLYLLSLDFNCFDIGLKSDRRKIGWLGSLFYEDYDHSKVNDPVYVGSKLYMTDMAFEDYKNNFKVFLSNVKKGKELSLPYLYRFIVSDNTNLDFNYVSLLDIKYNPEIDLTSVRVKMELRDKFSVLLNKSREIDIILKGSDSDVLSDQK
ncbi:MAG: hypothetical protein K0B07_00585 [DPANN group archaeon]|nr:hypothetical protein [DPANN group archaeon]